MNDCYQIQQELRFSISAVKWGCRMSPTVSVVLHVYNGERYLTEAVESILDQGFGDFELIVIDDGSTDSSARIIESFSDLRLVSHYFEHNQGLVAALNFGISKAKGRY